MAINFPPTDDTTPDDGSVKYTDPDNGREYYWNGYAWELVCDSADNLYLLAHGDDVDDCTEAVEYDWNESVKLESPKAIELQAGLAKVAVSKSGDLERAELSAGSDCYIHVDLDDGDRDIVMRASSYMVYGSHCHYNSTNLFNINSEGSITLESDVSPLNLKSIASDIKINAPAGKEVVERIVDENSDPKQITNKEYVDAQDEELRQSIITIDEELESIAPSTERGQWVHEQASDPFRSPNSGKYFLIKGITSASDIGLAQFTEDYTEATGAVFSSTDNDGVTHTWNDVEAEELIDLLDKPDPDGLFGTIKEIDTTIHSTGAAVIILDPIQSIGSPTNNAPYLTNVRIFSPPTGGTASEFVKKIGDEMTGRLLMQNNVETVDYSSYNAQARITFKNTQADGSSRAVTLYQPGNATQLVCDQRFRVKDNIYAAGNYYGWDKLSGDVYDPNILLDSNNVGHLQITGTSYLTWDDTDNLTAYKTLTIDVPQNSTENINSFVINGRVRDNNTGDLKDGVLLKDYRRQTSSGSSDYIAYYGGSGGDYEIVNKKAMVDYTKKNTKVKIVNSAPASPEVGDMWFNTNTNTLVIRTS